MLSCSVELTEYRTLVGRTLDQLELEIGRAVEHAAVEAETEAKRAGTYQDRTGYLRSAITAYFVSSSGRSVTWELLSPAKHSVFVENPTRPHVIRAKRARALRFQGAGGVVFAQQVNHPGTRGYPFMGPAYQQAERTLTRELEQVGQRLSRIWS